VAVSQDNPGAPHYGPFGAADWLDPRHFISGATDYGAPGSYSGFYYTRDGGATWAGGNLPGPYPGGAAIVPAGDAAGAIDALGPPTNAYFADLGTNLSNDCIGGAYIHRSTDGGATFQPPVRVVASTATDFIDKNAVAADKAASGPYAGRLYYTVTDFGGGPTCDSPTFARVEWTVSTDQGATWSPPAPLPQPAGGSPAGPASTGSSVAAAAGGVVYAVYNFWTNPAANDQRNYITRSTDGGVSFGPYHAITSAALPFTGYVAPSGFQYYTANGAGVGLRHSQFPALAISPTDPNTVYVLWNHHDPSWNRTYQAPCCGGNSTPRTFLAGDIAFSRSTDGGVTWSAPLRLNDDPPLTGHDHFLPAIAVGPDGTIHVAWYDRREDPANRLYQVYAAQSTDGGLTWSANTRVSDAPSDPAAVIFADGNAFLGNTSGIAASAAQVLPFWTDTRAGTPPGEQRIYTDPGPPAPPSPTATATPIPPSPTPCTAGQFSDVHPGDYFYTPVMYLASRGVIAGYADCTFRPSSPTTRAQMVKIVVLGFEIPITTPPAGAYTFADVPPAHPFFTFIETAATHAIVSGYDCGGPGEPCDSLHRPYLRPSAGVTRGQLAKIVVGAAGYALVTPPGPTFVDVPADNTFYSFVETAACHGILSGYTCGGPGEPCDAGHRPYFRPVNGATRGQIAKIVYGAVTGGAACGPP
jgi:hypothetical protein